ncbi:putative transmembrane protein [Flagelloscypha sp. PMI_526]|nr:putative transmembrane protein [Flagelloscypha sp. PMI_526]
MHSSSRRPPGMSGSSHLGASSSRPFLTMLGRNTNNYQGYMQANQSVVEEDHESSGEDVETGRRSLSMRKSRRVSWDAGASELAVLRPNIQQQDPHDSSDDNEPPKSFLVETVSKKKKGKSRASDRKPSVAPVLPTNTRQSVFEPPRPSDIPDENYSGDQLPSDTPSSSRPSRNIGLDPYERALWNWVNVYNLDAFLQDVYFYYEGKGIYNIALSRGLNLLTVGFVISFSTFLLGCVDYSRIKPEKSTRLSDVIVESCVSKFSGFTLVFFLLFTAFYLWQIFTFVISIQKLVDMYRFYTYLLKIPDADIPTISWPEVVRRIGNIREENPLTAMSSKNSRNHNDTAVAKLDAHDIANRIMRQENYLIALFNKELLDLRVPLPHMLQGFFPQEKGNGQMLTRALEWNLRFCLMEYLFDQQGRVRKMFLKYKNRAALIDGLRRRFIFMGILNAIFAPFIVLYLLMYSFFRYFEQYHKDPSTIGGRRYTSFAQWKFREFNELPHFFARRLDESYPSANMYIGQFPNDKLTIIMRFVAFVAGSFAAVLVLASILDPDLVVHFEITPHRTVLFYITIFGSILAVARGIIPEEGRVFDPELLMMEVISFTHYMPDHWRGLLHSKQTHAEFGELFAMKILIFPQEVLSVVLTPFVLWFSLPQCAPAVIDFFRDFTVHVDSRGYVCSFAEFNFERHGNVKFGASSNADKKMLSKEGKMEKSFLHFKATNPDWNPTDPSGSLFLSRMADFQATQSQATQRSPLRLERRADGSIHDRGQEYDRALLQSQHAAMRRRMGMSGMLGMSTLNANGAVGGSSMFGGMDTAQTAILGDSQGSTALAPSSSKGKNRRVEEEAEPPMIPDEDGLGESYVDGARRSRPVQDEHVEDEEDMEDGGVIGLLAQIYGRKEGAGRVL